ADGNSSASRKHKISPRLPPTPASNADAWPPVFLEDRNDTVCVAENDFARMVGGPPPESLSGSPGSQHYRLPGPRSDHNCSIDENAGRRRGHHGIACDIVELHRLGWRVSAHTRHLFHSSVPSFKREPRTAIVADGPKARDENLTRSTHIPCLPTSACTAQRERTSESAMQMRCASPAASLSSGQSMERNACTM